MYPSAQADPGKDRNETFPQREGCRDQKSCTYYQAIFIVPYPLRYLSSR